MEKYPEEWTVGWFCLRAKPRMELLATQSLKSLPNVEVFFPRTVRSLKERTNYRNHYSLAISLLASTL